MQIHFERSGGFAGMRMACSVDAQNLPQDERQKLMDELERANFFELPHRLETAEGGADRFRYRIEVEMDDEQHEIEADESAVPEKLWPLVQHLTLLARSSRGSQNR